jgi:hypothetical protein
MKSLHKLASMAAAAGLAVAGLAAGSSPAAAVEHPTLMLRSPSQNYNLYWDACQSSTGWYWFLEGQGSVCGVGNAGDFFSFAYVSFVSSNGQRSLEVCHSGNHSGTTTLYDYDTTGRERHVSDSAGGGCAVATRTNLVEWLSNWGGEDSPVLTAP